MNYLMTLLLAIVTLSLTAQTPIIESISFSADNLPYFYGPDNDKIAKQLKSAVFSRKSEQWEPVYLTESEGKVGLLDAYGDNMFPIVYRAIHRVGERTYVVRYPDSTYAVIDHQNKRIPWRAAQEMLDVKRHGGMSIFSIQLSNRSHLVFRDSLVQLLAPKPEYIRERYELGYYTRQRYDPDSVEVYAIDGPDDWRLVFEDAGKLDQITSPYVPGFLFIHYDKGRAALYDGEFSTILPPEYIDIVVNAYDKEPSVDAKLPNGKYLSFDVRGNAIYTTPSEIKPNFKVGRYFAVKSEGKFQIRPEMVKSLITLIS